jgi:adenylate cyclase
LQGAYLETEIEGEVREFPIVAGGILRIGRSEKSDIVLCGDDLASRNHAMLQCSNEGIVYLTDCGSSNGTLVNGSRIVAPLELRPADQIRIGHQMFCFRREGGFTPAILGSDNELQPTNVAFLPALITVLVADIRDFTGLAQQVDAKTLALVTGTLFREAGKCFRSAEHGRKNISATL